MDYLNLGSDLEQASQLVLGCMRLAEHSAQEGAALLAAAGNIGINFFDHSDVYADGTAESRFAQALQLSGIPRSQIFIQSKCGLRDVHGNYHFDSSKEHILASAESSLRRLQTDYLDLLLLHRPDALIEPEEVAEAFYLLHKSGKVRAFGVSNYSPYQIELLQQSVDQHLTVNQLQFGPAHPSLLDAGLNVNTQGSLSLSRDGGLLDYCRLHRITIQPWSPFQVDLKQGLFMEHPHYQELTAVLQDCARRHAISFEAMVLAWILRHPAKMQPIVGSMNPQRLRSMADAFEVDLTRDDWYKIYKSSGRALP